MEHVEPTSSILPSKWTFEVEEVSCTTEVAEEVEEEEEEAMDCMLDAVIAPISSIFSLIRVSKFPDVTFEDEDS